jgi:O-antigen/teichoic acid export membrane protein
VSSSEMVPRPSFLANLSNVLGGQFVCAALAVVTEICYSRLLGPAIRGQISLCMMSIGLGVLIGGLGGDVPIAIWASAGKKRFFEWLPSVLLWGLGGCLLSMGLWALAYWRLHPAAIRAITPPLANLSLWTIPVAIFSGYLMAILTGEERFRLRATISVADQAAGLAAFLLLVLIFGRNAESAVLGNLIGIVVGGAFLLFSLRGVFRKAWIVPSYDKEVRSGLLMGLRGQFGNAATFFNYRLDVFILGALLNPTQVGLYALGVVVSEALWQVPQAVAFALFPRTARTLDSGARQFTCMILRQVFLAACAMGLAVALASPVAVPLVFGARFAPSVAVIWWILPGTIALSMGKVACADLTARYKNGYTTVFSIVGLVVTVALDLVLIPHMGIKGAAIASSISYTVFSGLILAGLRHELQVKWKDFFIPNTAELARYGKLALRCKAWLWTPAVSADSNIN